MAGIYIHIPFCIQRCHYCDFYSTTLLQNKPAFINALKLELKQRLDFFGEEKPDTIYFGGGTPSLLSVLEIEQLICHIRKLYTLNDAVEITLEANPDDLNLETLKTYRSLGIDRLSLGIQSFRDADLKLMNRRHDAAASHRCLAAAEQAGFEKLSVDLIYGLPDGSFNDWEYTLDQLGNYQINHLSAYHLSIEKGTPFHHLLEQGKLQEIDEQLSFEQYQLLRLKTQALGYEQYEISNFAKKQNYSKHNCKYWDAAVYLGVGPSAHSYTGHLRQWNPPNLSDYINCYTQGKSFIKEEIIGPKEQYNELLMTRLRTMWGINKKDWKRGQNLRTWDEFMQQIEKSSSSDVFLKQEDSIKIHPDAWFRADGIIADLFEL